MLFTAATLSAVLLPSVSYAAVTASLGSRANCKDVHLFLARGNGEAYPGRVGAISDTVCSGLPSCDYENIMFNSQQSYCQQAADGVSAGQKQIANYAASCPNSKLVLAGYSLGAHIVGDILGGGGGNFYGCTEASSSGLPGTDSAGHISVVLMFGDVRHVGNKPYNTGDGSSKAGQYPRSGNSLANLDQFGSIMRSWCLDDDPICAGGNNGKDHETYMDRFAVDAGYYAQGVLGFAEPGSSSAVSDPEPTPTPFSSSKSASSITGSPTVSSSSTGNSSSSTDEDTSSDSSSSDSSVSTTSSAVFSAVTSFVETTSSEPPNTYSEVPFVFASQTSTFKPTALHTTLLSALPTTKSTKTYVKITTAVEPTATSADQQGVQTTSSSVAAGYTNAAGLTLNVISLVVIKVLIF